MPRVKLRLSEFKNIGDKKPISPELAELIYQRRIWIKVTSSVKWPRRLLHTFSRAFAYLK